jgi:hypothetical protein
MLYDSHGSAIRRRIGFISSFARAPLQADIKLADCIGSRHTAESEDSEADTKTQEKEI